MDTDLSLQLPCPHNVIHNPRQVLSCGRGLSLCRPKSSGVHRLALLGNVGLSVEFIRNGADIAQELAQEGLPGEGMVVR